MQIPNSLLAAMIALGSEPISIRRGSWMASKPRGRFGPRENKARAFGGPSRYFIGKRAIA